MCAVVAVGATLLTTVTILVLGNILREIAIETLDTLRVWWARVSGMHPRVEKINDACLKLRERFDIFRRHPLEL